MGIQWIDVTIPMAEGMTVWPGDPPYTFEPESRIDAGDSTNVSIIRMSTHTGTHVDAPWHFEPGGKRLHELDSSVYFGNAQVIDARDVPLVHAEDLGPERLHPRVLIKTRNSRKDPSRPFDKEYVALAEDAAQRLVDEGVRLVGVDYLSVAPFKQPGQATHHILLQSDVFVVEGLVLAEVPEGTCQFVVLPMPLIGADGAPCRAFVGISSA